MTTILVVDDSAVALEAVRRALAETDLELILWSDPFHGFMAATKHSIDLILLDFHMPGIDGQTLATMLLEASPNPPPIVLYSSADTTTLESEVTRLGLSGYIRKTADLDSLRECILAYLRHS